jgi:hypothetical protein
MGFGQKSIQAPATNHLAKRHVAGACGGTGDSDCVARTLTRYTSNYLDNWISGGYSTNTVYYTITNIGATYSRSTSTLTVNFNYTINNINGNSCNNNSCPVYPVLDNMHINVIFTDDSTNIQYSNYAQLLGNGSSVTLNTTYTTSLTIENLTLTPGSHNWTITGDNSQLIYNNNSIVIYSSYSADPVQFSFTV